MKASGAILAGVLNGLADVIKPGISAWEIEQFADRYITEHGAKAEEKGFEGYKYATCVNVNDEVAHATPRRDLILKTGDVVAVDLVVNLDGFLSDACRTYAVGEVSAEKQRLLDVTRTALYKGIEQAVVGNRLGDIGAAIQHYVEDEANMGDVRELIGHGIQPTMHEQPDVPAYGQAGRGLRLKEGMTITIEPMVNLGSREIRSVETADHSWEYYVTYDGSPSAQFEHTIVITKDGPKILTSQDASFDQAYL
ncbi:methionine aminopeptidase [Secundilactobacillus odoratitofui DSM 19909 = JCM 15043]|uniref:Methionine aminopeptidase n=2 Tax=Secundilactobacillus odoratitofui TaxID=480930 RepID=A0A0R1LW80_9LACO|nr:methionine aminopeptidase [Secundilactobacillus odoratitofui DSM 19909 = JCM 15043]